MLKFNLKYLILNLRTSKEIFKVSLPNYSILK